MSDSYTLDDVRKMGGAEVDAYSLADVRKMQGGTESGTRSTVLAGLPAVAMAAAEALGNPDKNGGANFLLGGPLRGAANIGNTILGGKSFLEDQLYQLVNRGRSPEPSPFGEAQKERKESQRQFFAENFSPDSAPFKTGQLGTEIAGTAGVGSVLAKPIQAVAGASPTMQAVANAVQSAGMRTGVPGLSRTADLGIRTAGGAITGGASVGLVDPQSAGVGAAIGGVLPGALQAVRGGVAGVSQGVRNMRPGAGVNPGDVRTAKDLASMAGVDVNDLDQVARLRDALRQQGPQIIPGGRTAPEILQAPGVSQLQRSVKAVQPAPFVARDAERELARRDVLERIAPIGNPREVAQDVGTSIAEYAIPQHEAVRARVRAKFGAVDPFNESRVLLPIDRMQSAKDKFLGPGTFGSGRSAQQAIDEATRIGTEILPTVRPVTGAGKQPQDILQAVRKLGGISPNSAGGMNREIIELGRKQSGTTGLVSSKGRTIDEVAELMAERGFLSKPDPAELLDAMRGNLSGRPVFGADVADDAFRARLERSMGDAPEAGRVLKPVPFEELQNLRSSIGEKAAEARRFGNAREAAALMEQQRAIDAALEKLAAGRGQPGEYFADDMVRNYKDARAAHAAKELRFKTGPQAGIFRQGGDGLPQIQGGEIPRKFFNGNASQLSDAQSFRRLVQDDPRLMGELRRFAVSDAASQADRFGNLTNAKFSKWLDARTQATGQIFTEQQRAWLKAIADDLRAADVAESLGRSTGSDTAQKAASMMRLGLLDSPATRYVAGKVPFGGAALDYLGGVARTAKAERIGGLLMEPERAAGLLDAFIATRQPRATGLLGGAVGTDPLLYQAAPLLLSGQGR